MEKKLSGLKKPQKPKSPKVFAFQQINQILRTIIRAVVVAQLVERSLLTPEIRGLNPNIG